jgi:predicted transcriptional regulator
MKKLDKKEEELAYALIKLGLGRPVARILAYLQTLKDASSDELEWITGMRQPNVSNVMKLLKERDWVNERKENKAGKSKSYNIYSLNVGFNDIITQLETERKKADVEDQVKIEQLKELGK